MRRWVRYEASVMVWVDIGDAIGGAKVRGVEPEDIMLARDDEGSFLVYDDFMNRLSEEARESKAVTTAALRSLWPDQSEWEDGGDTLLFPGLYDPVDEEEKNVESLDLDEQVTKP